MKLRDGTHQDPAPTMIRYEQNSSKSKKTNAMTFASQCRDEIARGKKERNAFVAMKIVEAVDVEVAVAKSHKS